MRSRFIVAFTKFNGLSWITKSPFHWIGNLVLPVCLVFIIYLLSGGKLLAFAIAGGFIAMIAAATLSVTGQSAMFRLEFKIQDLLIATRATPIDYILALAFADMFFVIPGVIVFTLLSVVFHLFTIERFLITIAVIFMLALATTAIAFLIGSRIKRTISMWAISGIVSAVMTLIPPTFYPYTVLPTPVLYVFALSPVTPAAATLQGLYGLAPMNYLMPALLAIEVIVYMGLAKLLVVWRDG